MVRCNDIFKVDRRYRAELEQKRKQEERIWRVQEVEEEWKHIVGEDGDEDKEEYERKVNTIGREKLWKVKEDHDEIELKGKRFIRGTERLWTKCLFEVQAKKIKESCEAVNLDPVVAMIKIWYKETKKDQKSKLLIPSLQHQVCTETYIHASIHPSVHSSIHSSIHPSIFMSIHPSVRPSIRLSIHLSLITNTSIYNRTRTKSWNLFHATQITSFLWFPIRTDNKIDRGIDG